MDVFVNARIGPKTMDESQEGALSRGRLSVLGRSRGCVLRRSPLAAILDAWPSGSPRRRILPWIPRRSCCGPRSVPRRRSSDDKVLPTAPLPEMRRASRGPGSRMRAGLDRGWRIRLSRSDSTQHEGLRSFGAPRARSPGVRIALVRLETMCSVAVPWESAIPSVAGRLVKLQYSEPTVVDLGSVIHLRPGPVVLPRVFGRHEGDRSL